MNINRGNNVRNTRGASAGGKAKLTVECVNHIMQSIIAKLLSFILRPKITRIPH